MNNFDKMKNFEKISNKKIKNFEENEKFRKK